jgi:arabinan endo-1,5-alpha-L-arabinosidase
MLLSSHGQVYGPGGPGVVQDKDLGVVMYYHYFPLADKQSLTEPNKNGYKYSWNVLGWENGWPYVKAN